MGPHISYIEKPEATVLFSQPLFPYVGALQTVGFHHVLLFLYNIKINTKLALLQCGSFGNVFFPPNVLLLHEYQLCILANTVIPKWQQWLLLTNMRTKGAVFQENVQYIKLLVGAVWIKVKFEVQ